MGGSASMCLGKSRAGRYRVISHPPRNDIFTSHSDFGMKDNVLCHKYRDFEDIPRAKGVTKDDDVVLGENEKNETREKKTGHVHELVLPEGGAEEVDTLHPDLPEGVTCITCAATMMEDVSRQETDDNGDKAEIKTVAEGGTPAGEMKVSDLNQMKMVKTTDREQTDENENASNQGKGTDAEDSTMADKVLRGSRWRRRYKALTKSPAAALKSDV